jgi:ATP-dependent DNA helicase RecG
MDELGSGILNVNKYLPFYAPGKEPVFEEGDVFKMLIPIETVANGAVGASDEGINEGISEGINEGINERQLAELRLILKSNGCKASTLEEVLNIAHATVERDIARLKQLDLVVYTGSKKTGKYMATEKGKNQLFPNKDAPVSQ